MASHPKYLGLPVVFGMSKHVLSFVMDYVRKKLKGWKDKEMSGAEREVLIMTVSQDIPSYIMSSCKIPEGCCDQTQRIFKAKYFPNYTSMEAKLGEVSLVLERS